MITIAVSYLTSVSVLLSRVFPYSSRLGFASWRTATASCSYDRSHRATCIPVNAHFAGGDLDNEQINMAAVRMSFTRSFLSRRKNIAVEDTCDQNKARKSTDPPEGRGTANLVHQASLVGGITSHY